MRSIWALIGLSAATLAFLSAAQPRTSEAQSAPEAASAKKPAAKGSGSVGGVVSILKDGAPKANKSGVVVYLENVPGPLPEPKKREIRQKNLTFTPGVMVIVKGTTVEFPNDDKVFHNVFSVSKAARFDLGLYKSGTTKAVTFKQAGVVDVYCNIHPQMIAKIKVLDTGYYAVTASDGSFRIKDVPPGTYPIVAWQANGEEYRGEVQVTAGATVQLSFPLAEGKPQKIHLRKDGTPYGRYK
jgi:plastocyanin